MLTSRLLAAVVTGAVAAALLTTPALAAEGGGAAPTAPQQSTTPGLDAPAQDTTASTSTGTGSRTPSAAAAAVRKSPKADRVLRGGDPTSTVSEVLRCTTTKRHFVSVPGPAGITIGGWARCSGGVGTFTAVSGTGRIGGRTLPSDGFSGTITGTGNGATTGQISAVVPDSPQILPSSTGRLLLVMVPQGSGWKATVVGTQSSRAGALRMSGPLAADGSFTMSVRGAVRFAGGQVPVRGSFRSAYASRKDWWDVKGTGGNMRTAGATLLKPSLTLSSTRKGISGTTQARITQLGVTAPARLDVVGADTWRATVTGSATETVNDPRLKGLVLSTGELAGHFGMRAGSAAWAVTVPMALSSGRVKVRGGATLGAPDAITLKPAIAFGDVFSQGRTVVFTRSLGSLTLAGSKAFGQLVVGASGEELVDMPSGWLSSTVLSLSPRKVGKSWTLSQAVRYGMREGTTEFTLVGDLPVAGPFSLKAEGHLQIGQTAIPITGSYTSPGYAGSPAPRMNITAKTDDAPGGFAVVSPGAHATDRIFTYSTDEPASSALATRSSSMPTVKVTTTSSTSSSGGSITLQVNDVSTSTGGDTIELTGGWTYSNNTYTITVQGEGDGFWEPYDGMDIPIDSIEGVIKLDQQKNVTSWSVTTGSVSWDVGDGITIEDTLSLSSTCPSDQVSCPTTTDDTTWDASDAFFISGTSSIMNIPVMSGVTIPSLSGSGAFLSNATWVRWDAAVDGDEPITVEGPADSTISMDQATVTIFSGTRDDSIPNLQMPDLSALSKNKVNVQACGTFQVVILDINTGKSKGCVGLTSKGKAMGQTGTGGTAPGGGVVSPTDDDSGLTLSSTNPPAVNGYGYSDIPTSATPTKTSPTMKLYNQIVTLVPGQNNFSANITIPGELIESFGTGITTDTTLVGTGWFAPKTNSFYVDVDVPVNLEVSGAKLEDINVSLTRVNKSSTDHYYDFELDASGEVHIQSHHFPFDASFGLKEGTQDYADISLTVIGEASTQPIGTFDDTSLLSEGDFEPPNVSLIDGSFDGTAPPSDFADGGFEAGLTPNNLIADPSFEDSASFNLLPADAATLDGDVSGNILPNPSYDDVDVLVNGDFEGLNGFNPASVNAWPGWTSYGSTSLYTYTTAGPDSNNPGDQSLCVNNTSSSSTAIGGAQQILGALVAGATYQLSGYVTSGSSSSASAKAYVVDSSYNSLASTSVTAPAQGTWQSFSVNYTPTSTGSPIIVLNAGSKAKACFDNVSLTVVSGSPSGSQITGVLQPDIIEDFDGASSTWDITAGSSVSRVDLGNGNGALKTDGSPNGYWAFKPNGRGDIASGAFDMSVNIYMPGSSGREVADVGFWMSGSGSNATGYIFRLETAHGDGGFYRLTGSGLSAFGGTAPNLDFQTWYNLRIVGYNNQHVVAQLTNLATGDVVYTDSEDLPSSGLRINGVFGQYPDNSTSGGSYWDDFSLSTPSKGGAYVVYGPNARSAPGYLNLTGTVPGWDFLTSAGTSPNAGDTYTYSAYVRSASSTPVTANLRIASVGGSTPESRTQSFTVGSTWTQVRVSIPLQYAHTDMRIGITDASAAGTILVDDQVLQRVPYSVSPTDSTAPTLDVVSMNDQKVNLDTNPSFESNANGWVGTNGGGITRSTAQAYTGTASGQLTRASGSTSDDYVEYQVNGVAPSTTYTVSGYVWLPTGADPSQVYDSRDLLWAVNYTGGTIVTSTQADFTKTGQWQRLSTTITTSATANTLNVRFYTPTGGGWFVDGILVEAGPSLDDYFEGSVDLPNAGNVLLVSPYDSNSKISYTVGTPNAGSTYSFTAQVKSTDGSSFPVNLAVYDGNGNKTSQQFTVTGSWTSVGPVQVKSAGGSNFKVAVEAVSGTKPFYLDNAALMGAQLSSAQKAGTMGALAPPTGWTTGGVLLNDPPNAHTGKAYMTVAGELVGSQWNEAGVVPGQTYAGSAWVKAPAGYVNESGWIALYTLNADDSILDSYQVTPKPVPGGDWLEVPLTLPVTHQGVKTLSLVILNSDPTHPLYVDDVNISRDGLSIVDPWSVSGNTGLVSLSNPSVAHSGNGYLQITTQGGAGSALLSSTVTPTTGARTFATWVKSATSGSVAGNLTLKAGSAQDSVNFTAGSSWTQVVVTVPVTAGTPVNLTHTIALSGQGSILVDDLESRDLSPFIPQGSGVRGLVVNDPAGSATPPAYLSFTTTSANTGVQAPTTVDSSGNPIKAQGGSTFTLRAQLKAPAGTTGTFGMNFGSQAGTLTVPQLDDSDSPAFIATGDWQDVQVTFTAPGTGTFTSITPTLVLAKAGSLQLDTVTISPVLIDQDQPWSAYEPSGTSVTWGVYDDPANAHDGSLGHLTMSKTGSADAGLVKTMQAPAVGQTYSATAWVRTADDDTATFTFELSAEGGSAAAETEQQTVTATQDWQLIQLRLPVQNAGHTDLKASLIATTPGVTLYVDDVAVVNTQWVATSGTHDVLNDGAGAYEGSGYGRLTNTGTSTATLYADATGGFNGTQTLSAYVRSGNDDTVVGYLKMSNGCTASSDQFIANATWQKVQLNCTLSTTVNTLRMIVESDTPGGVLDVDSVSLTNEPLDPINPDNVYGVNTPLEHPSTGYQYLWDDAFGIPGMHLWGFTVQVEVDDGEPGLSVLAAVYQDPSKIPNMLYGSDWIYGLAVINVDEVDPCFDFTFKSDGANGGNSGISIADGAIKAEDFHITFAPRGCAVGDYTVAPGASTYFDAEVGDGTIHFDLAMSKNAKGQPTFKGDVAVTDLNIGGIDYRNMIMSVVATPTDDSVTYVADMQLPMGGFNGNFNMQGSKAGTNVNGSVELTDWGWTSSSGKGLDINEFAFDFTMAVGPTNCGTFKASGTGNANADFAMASDLDFDGSLSLDCGLLTGLQFRFDYTHGDVTKDFYLNYNSSTMTLGGGVDFNFERQVSWKTIGIRYHRTSRIDVSMDFLMDITNPSSSTATLSADVKVANGGGSGTCTITGQPSDSCAISVWVKSPITGTKVYFNESW